MQAPAIFPASASTNADSVDQLFLALLAVSALVIGLVFGLVATFAVRYRRRSADERGAPNRDNPRVEVAWIAAMVVIDLLLFGWGVVIFLRGAAPPPGSLPIYVVGQQWMWKVEHPSGRRQINELVVPAGRPVELIMTSQDVIHSFFVPAFRMKMDVYPGRFSHLWFDARQEGTYHLFCAQYCGTDHSRMRGQVRVVAAEEYERWAAQGGTPSMAERGSTLFLRLGCPSCHEPAAGARGPALAGIFGRQVALRDGGTVLADETYLRQSVLSPGLHVVRGEFAAAMPSYQGQVDDADLNDLIAYLKSLEPK